MILKVQMEKTYGKDIHFVSFCKMVATDTMYFAIYKTSCSTALEFIRSNI